MLVCETDDSEAKNNLHFENLRKVDYFTKSRT
jgi:hypothetical protein